MKIQEPTTIELIDVNGRRKEALRKVNNIEISTRKENVKQE